MSGYRKPVYFAAGANTMYFGPGRKEFNPKQPFPSFEGYLKDTTEGTLSQMEHVAFDQGVIGSFMSAKFIDQANLPGFLPFMVSDLLHKPCTAVEGACGTGGRAIATAVSSILSDLSDATFTIAFEMQNSVKSVYGADVLAGAGYYRGERKEGHAFFFPGVFSDRAGAYFDAYDAGKTRRAMATWYEQSIQNARKNPKAQEYHNEVKDLFSLGMTAPNPETFLPFLNLYDCSKVSDGASSLGVFSEEGLQRAGINKKDAIELVAMGAAEGDITEDPSNPTAFTTTQKAVQKALNHAGLTIDDIGILEIHDCFTISGILSLEATGLAGPGRAPDFILEGHTRPDGKIPTNLSGGLGGFGHPTGASGVRQMVDLIHQFTGCADHQAKIQKPYGMMISMGGNDITVTCFIVKPAE